MSLSQKLFTELTEKLERPEEFALGSAPIQHAAIQAAKSAFDTSISAESSSIKHINALLSSLTPVDAPQTRAKSKAKGSSKPPTDDRTFNPTPLASLFVDDLEEEQVWAQLDLRTKHICELLDVVLEGEFPDPDVGDEEDELRKALEASGMSFDDEDSEEDSDMDGEDEGSEEDDESSEGDEEDEGDDMDEWDGDESLEGMALDQDSEGEGSSPDDDAEVQVPLRSPSKNRAQRTSEVDDDFFDLSSFKAEIEKAEANSSSRGHLAAEDDSDDSDLESVDLFAPVDGEEDMEVDDVKDLFYGDFFEAPRRVAPVKAAKGSVRFHDEVRVKKIKPNPTKKSRKDDSAALIAQLDDLEEGDSGSDSESDSASASDDGSSSGSSAEERGQTTIERLKDDLFADEEEDEHEQRDLSTHEKRLAALQAQISELEIENVGRKDWTLMGEADSRARPQNSLLEEDLEFDRAMKPVPLITEEKVLSLEELIKARIMEGRFDDVIRIRPMDDKAFLPSRILELQDTKSTQSLSQIYENEYMAVQGETSKVDDRDGKLKKEHDEIEALWDKICEKLDALSNAHFVPKQPKSIISSVSDVSTAAMESALPTTKSATSMLAPEEVFAAEGSQLRARSEMEPQEKKALRAKERKLRKKQRDQLDKTVDKTARARSIGGVKKQKQVALASIVKNGKGVTVVGKSAKDLKGASDKRRKMS